MQSASWRGVKGYEALNFSGLMFGVISNLACLETAFRIAPVRYAWLGHSRDDKVVCTSGSILGILKGTIGSARPKSRDWGLGLRDSMAAFLPAGSEPSALDCSVC